jgi:hypothetical protein
VAQLGANASGKVLEPDRAPRELVFLALAPARPAVTYASSSASGSAARSAGHTGAVATPHRRWTAPAAVRQHQDRNLDIARTIEGGIGHDLPQDAPGPFADAMLKAGRS